MIPGGYLLHSPDPYWCCCCALQHGIAAGRHDLRHAHSIARIERLKSQVAIGGYADHTRNFTRNYSTCVGYFSEHWR